MNNEWEQEMYIDPAIERMQRKHREMAGQWRQAREMEIMLVTGIVVTFIVRFLRLYFDAPLFFILIKLALNIAGLVLFLIDSIQISKRLSLSDGIWLVAFSLLLRPFYFIMRAGQLEDDAALKRGIAYGVIYCAAWFLYFGTYLDYVDSIISRMIW